MRKSELVAAFEENQLMTVETCQMINSSAEFLNMDLVAKYFKNKGIIINKENERFLLQSTGITFLDKRTRKVRCTFNGNLLNMIDMVEKEMYTLLPSKYPVYAVMEAVKNSVMYREYSKIDKIIEIILTKNSVIVISPGQLLDRNNIFGDMGYSKRNMWIYDKLISLDEGKRFINDGNGIVRIKEAFKGKRKVRLINSTLEDCFKVILPMNTE